MKFDQILTYVLLAALIACIGGVIYIIITPHEGEHFTEFYILGPGGKAADYPTDLVQGETGKVIVGVVNHEWEKENYRMVLEIENDPIKEIDEIMLDHGENWIQKISFKPQVIGENIKLQFLLYRSENSAIYRELHLWIDVASVD